MTASLLRVVMLLALAGCDGSPVAIGPKKGNTPQVPPADRPVAEIVSSRWSTEEARDP